MTAFNVWKDGQKDESITVEASDADMAQESGWDESEGLNIEAA